MDLLTAILLGFVQGIAEFLPISSSGHLVIVQLLLGFRSPPYLFDIFIHLASLAAIILFFWPKIKNLEKKEWGFVAMASLPIFILGAIASNFLDVLFHSKWIVTAGLILSGWYNLKTDHQLKFLNKKDGEEINQAKAFIIGLFQAVAIIPGVSRSGSSLYAATSQGLSRYKAFSFSFLIAIPAILGANLFQLWRWGSLAGMPSYLALAAGGITSFLVSLASLKILKKLVSSSQLKWFGWYCFALAVITAWLV